ncbi:Ferritin-like metal-binding protein YciE [Phyllobacterium sp. YR620]|uniref:YciE/YciF ferroxidase family protein n=1 Tax=Phyllobacterium sp. YR620 TaxID=1881066 RepID=UPI00088E8DC6|nr:DUF892 family protein [Phyllobacterium sp. YR620]SDO87670.1 Ferritin-like metal-binding protein YciE [Phyllobacterium sp. YR620]
MMQSKILEDLYYDGLKEIYYAERKILQALPTMSTAAKSQELSAAFQKHFDQTQVHVDRLDQVFELSGKPAKGKTCPAIDALIEEGNQIIAEYKDSAALDLGLAAGAQAVEHHEMARYGALKKLAMLLGLTDAADLLDATLQEEIQTDADLDALSDTLGSAKTKKSSK